MPLARGPALGYHHALDQLRGAAVLAVVAIHYAGPTRRFFPGAGLAVNVFFVLSGFLITRLLMEEFDRTGSVDIRAFMRRRIARLAPALLSIVAFFIVAEFVFDLFGDRASVVRGIVATLLYVRNWLPVLGIEEPSLGVAWSLAVEEQFYLLWPFAFVFVARRRRVSELCVALLAVAVIGTVARSTLLGVTVSTLKLSTEAMGLLSIMTGCLLAVWLPTTIEKPRSLRTLKGFGVLGGVVLAGFVFLVPYDSQVLPRGGWFVVALASAAVIAALVTHRPTGTNVASRFLHWWGVRSYAAYLWHLPLFAVAREFSEHDIVERIVALALTVAVAELSLRFIEQPAQKWIRSRGRAAAQPVSLEGDVDLRTTVELAAQPVDKHASND